MSVDGEVNLTGNVVISDYFGVEIGQSFVFILNGGTDPIVGQFAGLPEGSLRSLGNGLALQVTYQANGDSGPVGNDFGVTVVEAAAGVDRQMSAVAPLAVGPGEPIVVSYTLDTVGPGTEMDASFQATFPAGATFAGSVPPPTFVDATHVIIDLPDQGPGSTANVELSFTAPGALSAVRVDAGYHGTAPDPDNGPAEFTTVTAVLAGGQMPLVAAQRTTLDGEFEATIPTIQDVHYLFEGTLEFDTWYPIEDFYGDGLPRTIQTPVDEMNEFFRFRIIPFDS
jgi:hypothetical protein